MLIREMLFADDAALVAHTEEALQRMINSFSQASKDFGLIISLKKTNIMAQDTPIAPIVHIDNNNLEVVSEFTYLGSTMSSNLSLEPELSRRIGKASAVMSRMSKRVWENNKLTLNTKNESVPGVRTQHFAIRQRDMANLLSPGTTSQQCLPASFSHNHACHL